MRALVLFSVLLLGCRGNDAPAHPFAEVGVFFGGQMQRAERVEVPTARPPKIGFRVHFPKGSAQATEEVRFEIVKPGPSGRRVTQKGSLKVPSDQDRLDHVISLAPPRKLGVWNIRVLQGDRLLADRALYLVSPGPTSR